MVNFANFNFTSAQYLQRYIDEAAFRYNTASFGEGERFTEVFSKSIGQRTYRDFKLVA